MGCKLSAQTSEKTFTKQYIHATITYQKFFHQEQTFTIYWICIPEYNLIFNQIRKSTMHKIRNLKIAQHDTVTVLWQHCIKKNVTRLEPSVKYALFEDLFVVFILPSFMSEYKADIFWYDQHQSIIFIHRYLLCCLIQA